MVRFAARRLTVLRPSGSAALSGSETDRTAIPGARALSFSSRRCPPMSRFSRTVIAPKSRAPPATEQFLRARSSPPFCRATIRPPANVSSIGRDARDGVEQGCLAGAVQSKRCTCSVRLLFVRSAKRRTAQVAKSTSTTSKLVLIEPALKEVGLGGGTTGEIVQAGNIRERNRKQEYPTTSADGRMPNRSRDNRRSSREDRARRSALHIGPHEGFDRGCRIVRDHGEADAAGPCIEVFGPYLPWLGLVGVAVDHLDGSGNEDFPGIAGIEERVTDAEGISA